MAQSETFPQFEEQSLPCEGCSAPVPFLSSDPVRAAAAWADDVIVALCPPCARARTTP